MTTLTREELKNVRGGLTTPPPGCSCFIPNPNLPEDGHNPFCNIGDNPQLYCPAGDLMDCC